MIRFLVPILVAAAAPAHAAATLTLEQALQMAQQKQPQLRQAAASTRAAQARANAARAPLFPQLSASSGYSTSTENGPDADSALSFTSHSFNSSVDASLLVWDFGQTIDRYRAARVSAEATGQTEQATRLAVDLGVRTAYFNAVAARALVGVAREALANQERHLRQVQGFVDVGRSPQIDLAQVRTDRANAQVQLINAENGYEISKSQLNQAIGIEGSTAYDVVDVTMAEVSGEDQQIEVLFQEALKARPEIAALQNQVRAQELTVSSVRGSYWPQLALVGGVSQVGRPTIDSTYWDVNGGVRLSWPFFEGGLTRAQVDQARADLTNVEAQFDGLRQQLRLEVDQAWLSVRAAKAALGAAAEAVENARLRLELAEGRYQTGVGNVIELGDAQLALTSAEAQKVRADYNLAIARAQLLKALGRG
jgi:outer membrane protein